ncbi:hypothetical protein OG373_15655 [Streptomyces avidinii]|uniref:hypothetical protein n=1 Tax=Streptomyces avidinii TaxID=1895 RepID=UPI0038704BE1|nr:hypothetical protein OG373_15655 [Streptomyces avidinii]
MTAPHPRAACGRAEGGRAYDVRIAGRLGRTTTRDGRAPSPWTTPSTRSSRTAQDRVTHPATGAASRRAPA